MGKDGRRTARKPATKFAHLQKKLGRNKVLSSLQGKRMKKK